MTPSIFSRNSLEILEARIAPAVALPTNPSAYVKATLGGPVEVFEGQVLTTSGYNSGSYLLYVEKGSALVFFTDLNNNKNPDFNEMTGIAASDGLRLISYADIHGDIVTNLIPQSGTFPQPDGSVKRTVLILSDSDSNPSNDPLQTKGDGKILLNNTIEKIELRSLVAEELPDQNGDGVVDDTDVGLRKVESTYSIFGNIYAGKGFGASDGGLIIDATGLQNFGLEDFTRSQIGAIRTGTAASGKFFSFGASREDNISGTILPFVPPKGQVGGDIIGLRPESSTKFNLTGFYAGDGGIGARGGDISDIIITGDDTGGYDLIAGNGGRGPNGGDGGSIFNFSDLGSNTGKITIRSGNGGAGATGVGGNGGDFGFNTFNVRGGVSLILGSGGDGFTRGGDGTGLTSGNFSQPFPVDVIGGNGYGTTHMPDTSSGVYTARIGTHQAVDFDLDGFGDFVFTTKEPLSQLVVMFGDGLGGFRQILGPDGFFVPERYYLDAARNAEALVVADLNADGHPDIATGSLDRGSHAGVSVFLSQFEDVNGDRILTSIEDLNNNGRNDFTGFSEARFSALPQLERGDADTSNAILPYWEGPHQVGAITAGDYDGDGRPELGVVVTYYARKFEDAETGATTSLDRPAQVLVFLQPDQEFNNLSGKVEYTGQFFADFGTKKVSTPAGEVPAQPLTPFFALNGGLAETNVVETTALSTTTDHDVVIFGFKNATDVSNTPKVHTVEYFDRTPGLIPPEPAIIGTWTMGRVDLNRDLNDPGQQNKQDFQYVPFKDLTAVDLDADGVADLGILSGGSVEGFVIGVKGGSNPDPLDPLILIPTGGGATVSGNAVDNAGNFIGARGYDVGSSTGLALKSADVDGDGAIDDLALWHGFSNVALLVFQPGILPPDPTGGAGQTTGALYTNLPVLALGASGPVLFDVHFNRTRDLAAPAFASLDLRNYVTNGVIFDEIYFTGSATKFGAPIPVPALTTFTFEPIVEFGFGLLGGNGGNALVGRGGAGGTLGSPGALGTIAIEAIGRVRVFAGNGGNGFSLGGDGGYVAGVNIRGSEFTVDNPDGSTSTTAFAVGSSLVGGNGGRGVAGRGGAGGFLSDNSIQGGSAFIGGTGGSGLAGGNGGFVRGNGTGVYDSSSSFVGITAGDGGSGTRRAGNGGDITNFDAFVSAPTDSGSLQYIAGDGGDSVSGPGGVGGSIINSSPRANARLETDIYLESGDGGTGRVGGNAGIIRDFTVTSAAQAKKPAILSFIGGEGGYGLVGAGGAGGSLVNINVPSRGVPVGFPLFDVFDFNRALAGNGGGSASGAGGAGGGIRGLTSGADQGSFAVVAGAGGDGLTVGGLGGSVRDLDLATGASTLSKVLVIAGQGGSAAAFIPNREDSSANQNQNQFGGRVGRGGNGGSIIGVDQTGQTGAHFDFIAGNGGDTINYGTVLDRPLPFVGRGGSVQDIQVAGDIGNVDLGVVNPVTGVVDPSTIVAIKSYNDVLGGETVRQYADQKFRIGDPFALVNSFSDADGNVGIIVGAAGRNKMVSLDPTNNPGGYTSQPAQRGVNGSLIDIGARNILAAVAGSTDRIASIQLVRNIQVVNGIVGSDKPQPDAGGGFGLPLVFGTFDYFDRNGLIVPSGPQGEAPGPVLEGRLFDGAIVGKSFVDGLGNVVTPSGRSYRRS